VAYLGYVVGPPLIGLIASAGGLRLGLCVVVVAGALLVFGAFLLPVASGTRAPGGPQERLSRES